MPTILPTDDNNYPIPALRLLDGGAHQIIAGPSSARNAVSFDPDTRVISVYATVPVYLRLGSAAVTATAFDHYFPAHTYYDIAIGGDETKQASHIAALRVELDGMVYISEKI